MTHKFSANDFVQERKSGYSGRVMASYPGERGREVLVKGVPDARTGIAPAPVAFSEKALSRVAIG